METIWINGDEYYYSGEKKEMYGGVFYKYLRCNNSNHERWTQRKPIEFDNDYNPITKERNPQ